MIAGTPIHGGADTGLFEHLPDVVRPGALAAEPVVLSAVGGGTRHAPVVEHVLRPLFATFLAPTASTAIDARAADLTQRRLAAPDVRARVADTAGEYGTRAPHAADASARVPQAVGGRA